MKLNKWLFLLILMTLFVFSQSLLSGSISSTESSFIVNQLIAILNIFNLTMNFELTEFIIRKVAHFSEYFILGLIYYKYMKTSGAKNYYYLNIILTAMLDESIQFLHIDRVSSMLDVTIDSFGGFTAIAVCHFKEMLYNRHVKKIKE